MLTIFPYSDENYSKEILEKFKIKGKKQEVLVAKENDSILGYIAFYIDGYKICILNVCYIEEKLRNEEEINELMDSMIRAVSSFALNRKIFIICSENDDLFSLLDNFGFSRNDDQMIIDLSKILCKCKRCKDSKNR